MSGFVFLDVETPNRFNSRICSVGVVRTDDIGRVEYSEEFLVNPQQGFDQRNVGIHHINPSKIIDCPTFDSLWNEELKSVLMDAVLVAHNAQFDLNVLGKTLSFYGIEPPKADYVCTLCESKRKLTQLGNYGLDTVCDHYGILLPNHHDALCDASACREVFLNLRNEFGFDSIIPKEFIYSCARSDHRDPNRSRLMTDLYAITVGLSLDGVIEGCETVALEQWIADCERYRGDKSIDYACNRVSEMLSDGVIDSGERISLLNLARPFVYDGHNKNETVYMQQLIGIVKGISADRQISTREAMCLQEWLEDCEEDLPKSYFGKVGLVLDKVLADGVVTPDEERQLLEMFDSMVRPEERGDDEVLCEGKVFCLSGNFNFGDKKAVEKEIVDRGGSVVKGVSGKVSYVVVGSDGCDAYACGKYGTKVLKAMELQEKGKPIRIISEGDLNL